MLLLGAPLLLFACSLKRSSLALLLKRRRNAHAKFVPLLAAQGKKYRLDTNICNGDNGDNGDLCQQKDLLNRN
jgi:hypothetical protein